MKTHNEYTDCNNISGTMHCQPFHMSMGNPSFLLRDRGKEWLTEWHYMFGPSVLYKMTGDPKRKQPGEKDRFWMVAQWWKDQGGVVVDGVGVWKEPPVVEKRFKRINQITFVEDANGDVVMRFYEGYESLGPVKPTMVTK